MGFVKDIFSPEKGAGFQAQGVDIAPGITNEQLDTSHQQTQNGLYQQQAFIHALNAQNGIGNQNAVFAQQQGLANQLQNQANGGGPNPAQAMLNQATGQNVAQQQALMASQRGSSANAGLIARQAGMQGAGIQQQAAGQAATMGAQQQIAAQQALQQQQYMMGGLANQQVGQQQGALDSFNQSTQNIYNTGQNALANQNAANVAMQSNINNTNSGVAQVNAGTQGKLVGGGLKGLSGGILGFAGGGIVPIPSGAEPDSIIGKYLRGYGESSVIPHSNYILPDSNTSQGVQDVVKDRLETIKDGIGSRQMDIPAGPEGLKGSPAGAGEAGVGGEAAGSAAAGEAGAGEAAAGVAAMPIPLNDGGEVLGRARYSGDSYRNDRVPAMLSPHEIVLPRSITLSKDAPEKAKAFVAALLAKQGLGKGKRK